MNSSRLREKSFWTILGVFCLLLGLGQNCSKPSDQEAPTIAQKNNGGGYPGLTDIQEGSYADEENIVPEVPEDQIDLTEKVYLAYGADAACTGEPLSGIVNGAIKRLVTGWKHSNNLCEPLGPIDNAEVSTVAYNRRILVAQEKVYIYYPTLPSSENTMDKPIAFCRASKLEANIEIGTDVLVYSRNGKTFGRIYMGRVVDGKAVRTAIAPFPVTFSSVNDLPRIKGSGFNFALRSGTLRMTSAFVALTQNGVKTTHSLNCVVEQAKVWEQVSADAGVQP